MPLSESAFARHLVDTCWRKEDFTWHRRQGPVVVFLVAENKYRFHAPTDSFVDAGGEPCDPLKVVSGRWLEVLWRDAPALAIALDPLGRRARALFVHHGRDAVASWGLNLGNCEVGFRDAAVCRAAVARDGIQLAEVPWSMLTPELCAVAVAQSGAALSYVPDALRGAAICELAMRNGGDLQDVPDDFRSAGACLSASRSDALCWVPWELRDERMCELHLSRGSRMRFVPYANRSKLLIRNYFLSPHEVAVGERSLNEIPFALRDYDTCLAAVVTGDFLCDVPVSLRTRELCIAAAGRLFGCLTCIPSDHLSETLPFLHDLTVDDAAGAGIPQVEHPSAADFDGWLSRVVENPFFLSNVPERHRRGDLALEAVRRHPSLVTLVPEDARNAQVAALAARGFGEALAYIPEVQRSACICAEAIAFDGSQLADVPTNARDTGLCLTAVRNDAQALAYVPTALRDREMCMAAVEGMANKTLLTRFDLRHVPMHFAMKTWSIWRPEGAVDSAPSKG